MANAIKLKSSAVAGKVPTTSDLALRELAVNTYDGVLYLKKSVSGVESIVQVGSGGGANQADYGLITEAISSTADYGSIV